MTQFNVGCTVYDGSSHPRSKFAFHAKRFVALPPGPSIGLILITERDSWIVSELRWNCGDSSYFCVLEPKFRMADVEGLSYSELPEWRDELVANGWSCSDVFPVAQKKEQL